MKKGLLIFVLALVTGITAFYATRVHYYSERKGVLLDSMPELAWLHTELKLSDDQFAKASRLHVAYRPTCEVMCRNIAEAHARLETVARSGHGMSPELTEAIRDHARVKAECQQKMLEHLYQTASLLNDEQAARYLDATLPHALDSSTNAEDGPHHH